MREILKCKVCENAWKQRYENRFPNQCRKCHSRLWDIGYNHPCEICRKMILIPMIYKKGKSKMLICKDCALVIYNGFGENPTKRKSRMRDNSTLKKEVRLRLEQLRKEWLNQKL